jgi:hypothetical protein
MGGHGTWQIGVHFPDRFAAIGPSAGWISFWSYAGAMSRDEPNPVEQAFLRAASPSDTLALSSNYRHQGVYILHGDKDDNVPVAQARTMREHLAGFHPDFAYYEQPGAGHWWGNRCVDWPRMFEFFKHHQRPGLGEVNSVSFKTANPAVSDSCHWLSIEAQQNPLETSAVDVAYDDAKRRFTGTTGNVERLSIAISQVPSGDPLSVELDGDVLTELQSPAGTHRVWFRRGENGWTQVGKPDPGEKGPHRSGPFKEAFRHRMLFVYGTGGSESENAWALAKARFDAESFWYRGNGSVDIVPDTAVDREPSSDRNVILYGNADTNKAWEKLLGRAPILVKNGYVKVGDETHAGDDLSCLFIYPRPDSDVASVGAVAATGMPGCRAMNGLPYFTSGVAYPDYTVMRAGVLLKGSEGILEVGFFDNNWKL